MSRSHADFYFLKMKIFQIDFYRQLDPQFPIICQSLPLFIFVVFFFTKANLLFFVFNKKKNICIFTSYKDFSISSILLNSPVWNSYSCTVWHFWRDKWYKHACCGYLDDRLFFSAVWLCNRTAGGRWLEEKARALSSSATIVSNISIWLKD